MGAFQAFASGVGKTGADIGEGENAAAATAYSHSQDTVKNQQFQQQLAQQYQLAQQQHDDFRQQLIQNGWKDQGVTLNPADGSYSRTMYNENTNETRRLPVAGVPPDSPQGMTSYYKSLSGMTDDKGAPLFTDLQAKQIAFKMPNLYREGPAGMIDDFTAQAKELAAGGTTKIKGPNGQNIDISTPTGQHQYAQQQLDLIYGRAGYFHYASGSFGTQRDMTGFTPGEKREFDANTAGLKMQQSMLETNLRAEMAGAITPDQQSAILARYQPQLADIDKQMNDVFNGIKQRRMPQLPGMVSNALGQQPQVAPIAPPRPPNVPANYVYKNGPQGLGWYNPAAGAH